MGIIDTLKSIASGADSVKDIHDTGKYFHDMYIKPLENRSNNVVPLTLVLQSTAKVNQSILISGTGTGLVSLYSGNHLERELYPDKDGNWYIRLFFSVPGIYKMVAKDYYNRGTEISKDLEVVP